LQRHYKGEEVPKLLKTTWGKKNQKKQNKTKETITKGRMEKRLSNDRREQKKDTSVGGLGWGIGVGKTVGGSKKKA